MTQEIENKSDKLPSYKKPPVIEVVCGMRFRPPDSLRIPHFGLLWDKFRAEYSKIQHAAPITTTPNELLIDTATGYPTPRVWFVNEIGDQLIQFQSDRFYYNWRKKVNDYPRYDNIISNFEIVLATVKKFFMEFELGELEPQEYELTYINHIPIGMGWTTIDDLPEIFSEFIWHKKENLFLPNPEFVNWTARFNISEKKSKLAVALKQAIRKEDNLPVLVFELRTTGIDRELDIRSWFDLAHKWIVLGFTDLTTQKMHKYWEIEEND